MRVNDDYVLKNILNSNVLINVKKDLNELIKLNDTSKDILQCVVNHMNRDEIVDYLYNKYDVDKNQLRKDVDDFINKMIDKGVLVKD